MDGGKKYTVVSKYGAYFKLPLDISPGLHTLTAYADKACEVAKETDMVHMFGREGEEIINVSFKIKKVA